MLLCTRNCVKSATFLTKKIEQKGGSNKSCVLLGKVLVFHILNGVKTSTKKECWGAVEYAWGSGTFFLQGAPCLGFPSQGCMNLKLGLQSQLSLCLPPPAVWVWFCTMASIKVQVLLGSSCTCDDFICWNPDSVWSWLFQKDCNRQNCFSCRRQRIGENLLPCLLVKCRNQGSVKAFMGVKKSLSGSAAIFPESKKVG